MIVREVGASVAAGLAAVLPTGAGDGGALADKLTVFGLLAAVVYFLMSELRSARQETRAVIEANTAAMSKVADRLDDVEAAIIGCGGRVK